MKYCDLHIHSNASDGTFTSQEIVERAKNFRLSGIAITDHDTVAAVETASALAAKYGIDYVPALEISTSRLNGRMHILGYFIDPKNEELLSLTSEMAKSRVARIEKMCDKLRELGLRCDFDEVRRIAKNASIGRPHLAEHMVNNGIVRDMREAFRVYLADGGKVYITRLSPTPEEAISIIHNAGGLAVAAHPGVTTGAMDAIPQLAEFGIDGIEAYYPGHDHKKTQLALDYAKRFDLVATGGSDCHGTRRGDPLLGIFKVRYDILLNLRKRWEQRRR